MGGSITLCIVEKPQAVDELIELDKIFRGNPMAPGCAEIRYVDRHRGQRQLASRTRKFLATMRAPR
jgi:hypothetical protein